MSIAFGTVLLFLIFVPGVIVRQTYYIQPFSKRFVKTSAVDELVWAIVPGTILQVLGVLLVRDLLKYEVDFEILGYLLLGSSSETKIALAFQSLADNIGKILIYNLILWSVAAYVGKKARELVRKHEFDIKYKFLRFNNEWYYLLSGEILKFPEHSENPHKDFELTAIDALVNTGNDTIIYSGLLADFELSPAGGLDRIFLKNVYRRDLQDDNTENYYEMPGVFFVIHYSKIINLNIDYFTYEKIKSNVS